MPVYTLFGQPPAPAGLITDATAYTFAVEFSVTQPGLPLTGIWFFSAAAAATLPDTIALFDIAGASIIHSEAASWSGAAGSGWVRAGFTTPPALTAGKAYKAGILDASGGAGNWYASTAHYWDTGAGSGGIISGPLSAPSNAAATGGGQDTLHTGNVLTYPIGVFNATNYWVDPEVSVSAAAAGGPPRGDYERRRLRHARRAPGALEGPLAVAGPPAAELAAGWPGTWPGPWPEPAAPVTEPEPEPVLVPAAVLPPARPPRTAVYQRPARITRKYPEGVDAWRR